MCSCCYQFKRMVVGVDATADPVVLTVDRPLLDLPANHCFELEMLACSLTGINTNAVEITDGTTTLPMITKCTGTLRYDSLVACASQPKACKKTVTLHCYRSTDPEPGHVWVRTCLPRTSYVAVAAAAEAAGADVAPVVRSSAKKTDAA